MLNAVYTGESRRSYRPLIPGRRNEGHTRGWSGPKRLREGRGTEGRGREDGGLRRSHLCGVTKRRSSDYKVLSNLLWVHKETKIVKNLFKRVPSERTVVFPSD